MQLSPASSCVYGVNYYHCILVIWTDIAIYWKHNCISFKLITLISTFLDTFQTNFLYEYINSFETGLATQNSSYMIGCNAEVSVYFHCYKKNILNSEREGNLSFSFRNTLGNTQWPCFRLSLLSSFMEYSKL